MIGEDILLNLENIPERIMEMLGESSRLQNLNCLVN